MSEVLQWKFKRIAKKIKQKEIAQHMGISPSYVSLFEDEKVSWDKSLIAKYKAIITDWDSASQ